MWKQARMKTKMTSTDTFLPTSLSSSLLPFYFHPSLALPLTSFFLRVGPLSVAEGRRPPRSYEGRIRIGRGAFLHTNFHRSDWSKWWCRPRGSPVHPRSPDRSRKVLYSTAAPLLRGEMERLHENGVIKWDLGNEGYWHNDRLRQRLMHHKWGNKN